VLISATIGRVVACFARYAYRRVDVGVSLSGARIGIDRESMDRPIFGASREAGPKFGRGELSLNGRAFWHVRSSTRNRGTRKSRFRVVERQGRGSGWNGTAV